MNYVYQYVKFKSSQSFKLTDNRTVTEFILSTQEGDLGYGTPNRVILNKGLTIGDIRYQVSADGLQQVQNTTISFSNVGQFYHAMREINGQDFWNTLEVSIYWASGRITSLAYDGSDWLEDGETVVSFTPTGTYPLLNDDYIKKEFEGSLSSASSKKDRVTFSLVSKSKQDAYLVGSIKSFNGADSSRSLISPIVIGDLTDINAQVPLILKNKINSKSSAICSDIDLSEAPTPFIYDDENEKFHPVVNRQEAVNNNRQIEFYNSSDVESFNSRFEYVTQTKAGDPSEAPVLHTLSSGEVISYFTEDKNFTLFNDYTDPSEYHIQTTVGRLRDEGVRDLNNDGNYLNGTLPGYLVDEDMAVGIAKLNLVLYPENIKEVDPKGADIPEPNVGFESYWGFRQKPGTSVDFQIDNQNPPITRNGVIGAYKNVVNYRGEDMRDSSERPLPDYENASDSLWFSAHARGSNSPTVSTAWYDYNYLNKLRIGVSADYEKFKFDSEVINLDVHVLGAVYKDFETSNDGDAFDISNPSFSPRRSTAHITLDKDGAIYDKVLHDNSSTSNTVYDINDKFNSSWNAQQVFPTLSTFYDNPPTITFNGYTAYQPVKNTDLGIEPIDPATLYLDRADPSFYGSTRFALDGIRVEAEVKASVESKYWCFKGKTGDAQNINQSLNTLATRYNATTFTSADTNRNSWLLSGVHTGNPIYYRDLLSKIADEFRVFITDRNGTSELVSMGLSSSPAYTIQESNTPSPWNSSVTFNETPATDIYNKMVVRYAKNHMTGRYGKVVSIDSQQIQRTEGVEAFDDVAELQNYLSLSDSTLSKIGISEKIKTIDLEWVRDDYTANQILRWWCANSNRQRAVVKAEVSKLDFIDAKIGDLVDLDLPSLPQFYQVNYQIKKIVNKSNKRIVLEAEEIIEG